MSEAQSLKQASEGQAARELHRLDPRPSAVRVDTRDILTFFLVFRFVNALCVRTFFQPDEYFQALEPAWSIAFGADSGAWLTWVFCDTTRFLGQDRELTRLLGMAIPATFVATPSAFCWRICRCRQAHEPLAPRAVREIIRPGCAAKDHPVCHCRYQ
jgi:hypothetical protein